MRWQCYYGFTDNENGSASDEYKAESSQMRWFAKPKYAHVCKVAKLDDDMGKKDLTVFIKKIGLSYVKLHFLDRLEEMLSLSLLQSS